MILLVCDEHAEASPGIRKNPSKHTLKNIFSILDIYLSYNKPHLNANLDYFL